MDPGRHSCSLFETICCFLNIIGWDFILFSVCYWTGDGENDGETQACCVIFWSTGCCSCTIECCCRFRCVVTEQNSLEQHHQICVIFVTIQQKCTSSRYKRQEFCSFILNVHHNCSTMNFYKYISHLAQKDVLVIARMRHEWWWLQ